MSVRREKRCVFPSLLFVSSLVVFVSLSNCSFSFHGGLVVGHSFRSFPVSEWYECLSECASDNNCVSYNFKTTKHGVDFVCELNNCGFENKCAAEQQLIQASGYIFHQLGNIKLEKICRKKLNKVNTELPSEDRMKMAVSCSQRINVFVDEQRLTSEIILCPSNALLIYVITSSTRVIALEGMDDDQAVFALRSQCMMGD